MAKKKAKKKSTKKATIVSGIDEVTGFATFSAEQVKLNEKATAEFNKKFDEPLPDELLRIAEEEGARYVELMDQRHQAQMIVEKRRGELDDSPDLTGMYVDYRRVGGKIKFPLEVCVVFSVGQKMDEGSPRMMRAMPRVIDEIPVDIVPKTYSRIEPPVPRTFGLTPAAASLIPSHRYDPLRGGIAISHPGHEKDWGTLGLPVKQGSDVVFVTCQHVVSSSGNVSEVVQPPAESSSDVNLIGTVEPSNSTDPVTENRLDAAVVTSDKRRPAVNAIAWGRTEFLDAAIVEGTAQKGQRVFQIGAKTGKRFAFGNIVDVKASVKVINGQLMHGQILVEPEKPGTTIVEGGDSGSVLLRRVSDSLVQVIGLVHGKTDQGELVACHWSEVAIRFGLTL